MLEHNAISSEGPDHGTLLCTTNTVSPKLSTTDHVLAHVPSIAKGLKDCSHLVPSKSIDTEADECHAPYFQKAVSNIFGCKATSSACIF